LQLQLLKLFSNFALKNELGITIFF